MKNRFIGAAALLSLAIASCGDKDNFHINGELQNPGEVKKVYLLEADSARVNVVDSTNLSEDGKFSFKRPSLFANLYKLRIGNAVFDMIAENGDDIKFKTDLKDEKHAYEISGSKESEKIQEFNKINSSFGAKLEKISTDYQAAAEKVGGESDSLINIYKPQFMALMDEQSKEILKFVNENKTSLAAFYAATSLNPTRYEKELVTYADDIKDEFKTNKGVQSFIKQMELIKPISVGHKAPDFEIPGLNNKPLKLSDYKGKYVLIDFWASWCAPCRAEMPNVVKQYNKFKSKGLEVIGVSLDKEKAPWEASVKTMNMTWPQGSELLEWEGPTSRAYMVQAIPANFLLDPQGNIVAKNLVGTDLEDFLNKTFSKGE
ncbi:TlpA disulfide reductase family protein [Mucilaginibacter myungsuensis]|uniref:AhpC/TSA family protein n=1 Tax=Mucilaginibacter myungsuensis TaxID=649104 RepID=A0A929KYZ2_9SPHI|nr:TlpA disulfide reductase family protein [Mucilaginibacter myungsuensis]MBE9664284.1 AhpC/TSA family protein [Mucilaginibacter myungsuensis]MDN3599988.1 TlpA disulfide reductase family protein [Mucilaginibacter myungsuensis]